MDFKELLQINVSDKIEKKQKLSYLSWTWAWSEFKKLCPDAKYEIMFTDGLPYVYDPLTGYMVFTTVTVGADGMGGGEEKHTMWLPVMNGANKAMKAEPYTYQVKDYSGQMVEKTVEAATMFDINKTLMRCLVKNIAMFGLGLYIYAGEDLPEQEPEPPAPPEPIDLEILKSAVEACETLQDLEKFNTDYEARILGAPNKDAVLNIIAEHKAALHVAKKIENDANDDNK